MKSAIENRKFPRATYYHGRIDLHLTLPIPSFLEKLTVSLALFYRRLRYGYPFRRIPLTRGKYAIVDPDDYHRLSKYKWHLARGARTFYAKRAQTLPGRRAPVNIYMHRQILSAPRGTLVDHINHNGLDNRKANVRLVTPTQSNWHLRRKTPASSNYKGVSWHPLKKRWLAKITAHHRTHHLGYFTSELAAALSYDKAAKKLHGDFASLNFPVPESCPSAPLPGTHCR